MREKIYKKKKIRFTEKDFKILKRRFNYKKYNTIINEYGNIEHTLEIDCPLCFKNYRIGSCENCPLTQFEVKHNGVRKVGCLVLINTILFMPIDCPTDFYSTEDQVGYIGECGDSAKKQLDKLVKFLDSFKKV